MVRQVEDTLLKELAEKARNGCSESLSLLSEQFHDQLYRYIYRLTLNHSVVDDIRQETLLQLCKSIGDLRDVNNIKAWIFKVAWNKTANHFRANKKHQHMSLDNNNLSEAIENKRFEGLQKLVSKDIAKTLVKSISQLDPKLRSVLVLRCYEDLSYSEIASVMECSETSARVQFFRAKNKLKQRLSRKGITAPMFLGLLGLFGQVTSKAEAAVTVSASALEVGGLSATIGWILSKTGATVLLLAAGIAITAGVVSMKDSSTHLFNNRPDTQVKSFHFTKHAWKRDSLIPTPNLRMGRSLSKGAYEQWFFFPEGVDGPLFKMVQRWNPRMKKKLCSWLLNEDGQHYYASHLNIIYLTNDPLPKRRTARFPSDTKEYCDFLDQMEGREEGLEYIRDPRTGHLIELVDRRFANAKDFVSGVSQNRFDETEFGNFRYQWPDDAAVVDERDAIHQQGWTLFEISGKLNDQTVYGKCRIPFVYSAREEFPPLLKLDIAGQYSIFDCPEGAYVLDSKGKVITSHPSGTFFKGLLRPWFGLHTIDTVRRDAADCRVPFEVDDLDNEQQQDQKRIVTLKQAPGYDRLEISFHVNINNNEIQQIEFMSADKASVGTLKFSYPKDPESISDPIEMPAVKKRWFSEEKPMGILWLFELAQGTLGQQQ